MAPESHLKAAQEVASSLARQPEVMAVLLVGSAGRGIASAASDLDFAVLCKDVDGPSIDQIWVAGIQVDIEKYPVDSWTGLPDRPFLSLLDLRRAGRFVKSSVMFRSPEFPLEDLLARWERALPLPETARKILDSAALQLGAQWDGFSDARERLWGLQAAGSALAVLALSLEPIRFQKPKWVVRDLKSSRLPELGRLVVEAACARRIHRKKALALLAAVRLELDKACRLLGLREFRKEEDSEFEFSYLCETFGDAYELLDDEDFEGAAYVGAASLHMMRALLDTANPGDLDSRREAAMEWGRSAIQSVFGQGLDDLDLDSLRSRMTGCGHRLAERCRLLYGESSAKGEPFAL